MATIKVGARLKSNVCDTEVMVIACADTGVAITCGGAPVLDATTSKTGGAPDPAHAAGTLLGKRYVNAAGKIELLCVKAGKGSLAVNGEALVLKDAKPLPSSD
jgi:hypothetical protein